VELLLARSRALTSEKTGSFKPFGTSLLSFFRAALWRCFDSRHEARGPQSRQKLSSPGPGDRLGVYIVRHWQQRIRALPRAKDAAAAMAIAANNVPDSGDSPLRIAIAQPVSAQMDP
jgi:hypothetical protein